MSILSNLTSLIEQRLLNLLAPLLGPIKGVVSIFTNIRDNTVGILDKATNLVTSAENEYDQIVHFKSKPEWKNRVISVPKVIDHITELAQVPSKVVGAFSDLIKQLRSKLQPASFDLDELEGVEDLRAFIGKQLPKLAKGFEKLLGALALILDALVTINSALDDLQTIVNEVTIVRKDLLQLDVLFLQQRNPRKVVSKKSRIRVGRLHTV